MVEQGGEPVGSGGASAGSRIGALELAEQPGGGIGGQRFAGTPSKAEAHEGMGGAEIHGWHFMTIRCIQL